MSTSQENAVQNTFTKAMDQIDRLQKVFRDEGLLAKAVVDIGGNQDFGDIQTAVNHTSAVTSPTRIVMYGGAAKNEIQYHEIMSTGDFVDFGDLTEARGSCATASNGHGGL